MVLLTTWPDLVLIRPRISGGPVYLQILQSHLDPHGLAEVSLDFCIVQHEKSFNTHGKHPYIHTSIHAYIHTYHKTCTNDYTQRATNINVLQCYSLNASTHPVCTHMHNVSFNYRILVGVYMQPDASDNLKYALSSQTNLTVKCRSHIQSHVATYTHPY